MTLTPSLARRDLADMEARIVALERSTPRLSVARQAADLVSGSMGLSPDMHLTEPSINAGLGYCGWLRSKSFCAALAKMTPSLPKRNPPVLLGDQGKRVYDLVARYINSDGVLRTIAGECEAVRKYLHTLKAHKSRTPTPNQKPSLARAKLQLTTVTKFLSGGKRTIRGLANSGLTDRVGDIVEPKGGRWKLPVPLLWQHKHDQPIGWVREIEARHDGLWITAELATGIGKADESWRMIEAGLVDSYSIGFQADEWEPLPGGGKRFKSWSLLEISVVTIPADPAAKIRRGVLALSKSKSGGGVPLAKHRGAVSLIRATDRGGR